MIDNQDLNLITILCNLYDQMVRERLLIKTDL